MAAELGTDLITQLVGTSEEEQQVHNGVGNSAGQAEDRTTNQAGNCTDRAYGPHMVEGLVASLPAEAPVREENKEKDGLGHDPTPVEGGEEERPLPPMTECGQSGKAPKTGKKRVSEWVFRPLKLKFRVKELEELYKKYVFRQHQFLLFIVCVVLVIVSLMEIVMYLVSRKVPYSCVYCVCACVNVEGSVL